MWGAIGIGIACSLRLYNPDFDITRAGIVQLSQTIQGARMDIVIDTSVLVAVVLGEPEKDRLVEMTAGHALIGPGSIAWEIGNAFSAMLKQKRLTLQRAHQGLAIISSIPVRYVETDFAHALALADRTHMYAYDAYFLDCASRYGAPLLTLDGRLRRAARKLNLQCLEL
jgi:predicted nucleic acid-binding protein